jgi:hypothetical protein
MLVRMALALIGAFCLVADGSLAARAQTVDPVENAGKLLAECTGLEKAATDACKSLSTAVANGQDPTLTLQAVDTIMPGDLHILGPWKAAVIVRRTVTGWTPFAVIGSATGPRVLVTPVADAAQAAALKDGAATDPVARCVQARADAKDGCEALGKLLARGGDPLATLPVVDTLAINDVHVAGPWKAAIVLRRTINGWQAFALAGSVAGGPAIAFTPVADAGVLARLSGGAAGTPASAPAPPSIAPAGATTAPSSPSAATAAPAATGANAVTNLGEGWIVEVRPRASTDATTISDDLLSRYISGSLSEQFMGEYAATIPIKATVLPVTYARHGLLRVTTAGDYRFAVTFTPHTDGSATRSWTCWPHLDFVDGGNHVPVLPLEPIAFPVGLPAAQVKSLISSVVTIPAGLIEAELDVQCNGDEQARIDGFGTFLNDANSRAPNPWPTMLLSVQRPGEGGFTPLKKGEILYDRDRYKSVSASSAGARPVITLGNGNPLKELGLSADLKPGWYVDVYAIVGDPNAWAEPPTTAIGGTFISQPASFSLSDHRRAGMADKDPKIYMANTEFLALKTGRYTFVVVPTNPAAPNGGYYDNCVAELQVTDRGNNAVTLIDGSRPNTYYSTGQRGVSVGVVGGADLSKGAYRMALRAACSLGRQPDITKTPWSSVRFNVFFRGPDDNFLEPASPTEFVFKAEKH